MRPSSAQLEAFYWVARLGSVKEAARHLNVAPPTISLRIDQLEADLGHTMFERQGRHVVLTQRGEALVPHVAAVIEDYSKIHAAMGEAWQSHGVIRIGVTETFAQACLPAYMARVASRYPSVRLEFTVGTSADLEGEILERRLDLAFAINPTGDPKLTLVPLGTQPAVWAAAPSFNLPARLHPRDLAGILIVTNPPPAPMWWQITEWFRQAGLEPSAICRCTSPTMVAQLVAAGLGASLLPRRLVQGAIVAGRVKALGSKLPLHPSRMFAVFRFADNDRLIQDMVALGQAVMDHAQLIELQPS
ncbi:LysR family transcriptional regulator [Acidisoma silvae]|uniref:LysR family transcriptional regulator n=1 Tax=Acidisoma silvae TaxID=2802396 RepID=A0A964E1C3_9PROT|nr:LysR family transcriptional regulator [Acidisoma silvae]MCB8878084.1 LysR family transcriptional regulator [Acidisoma silvae]